MGRLLGLMLFCIGIGMVIGMLISENVIIVISAGLCLLCGYHMFADEGRRADDDSPVFATNKGTGSIFPCLTYRS